MTRRIDEIIVHCSATRPGWMDGKPLEARVAEIRRWHVKDRGWSDIGYHWIIDRDGKVMAGRTEEKPGAHCRGRNRHSIGICLLGGHGSTADDSFDDHFTPEQNRALRKKIGELQMKYADIDLPLAVSGHNQHANKACPGFRVPPWYERKTAPEPRTSPTQSTTVRASATQIAAGTGTAVTAVSALSGTAQIVALGLAAVIVLAGAWIMRERLKHWANGVR